MTGRRDADPSSDAQLIRDVLIAGSGHEGRMIGFLLRQWDALRALDRLERAVERERCRSREAADWDEGGPMGEPTETMKR